ncbi:MAG: hypothetical protein WCX65_09155 [bacterium]
MADVRNFRNYLEELTGNNYLKKKVKMMEKKNKKLENAVNEIAAELKSIKKNMAKPLPKPKGRKPRPMIKMIEDEMAKQPNKAMRVTDMVKMLKRKKIKTKATSLYSSVAASLANSAKFEKVAPGEYKIAGEKTKSSEAKSPKKKTVKKKIVKKKSAKKK